MLHTSLCFCMLHIERCSTNCLEEIVEVTRNCERTLGKVLSTMDNQDNPHLYRTKQEVYSMADYCHRAALQSDSLNLHDRFCITFFADLSTRQESLLWFFSVIIIFITVIIYIPMLSSLKVAGRY